MSELICDSIGLKRCKLTRLAHKYTATYNIGTGCCSTVRTNDNTAIKLNGHDGCLETHVRGKLNEVEESGPTPKFISPFLRREMSTELMLAIL